MVTFITDSTINVGPQPIKFAKFIQVKWEAVQAMVNARPMSGGGDGAMWQ
jgi:hypothetical protein